MPYHGGDAYFELQFFLEKFEDSLGALEDHFHHLVKSRGTHVVGVWDRLVPVPAAEGAREEKLPLLPLRPRSSFQLLQDVAIHGEDVIESLEKSLLKLLGPVVDQNPFLFGRLESPPVGMLPKMEPAKAAAIDEDFFAPPSFYRPMFHSGHQGGRAANIGHADKENGDFRRRLRHSENHRSR